jgi:Rieske Fe-S protein
MAEQSQPAADRRTVLRTTALGVAVAGVGVTAAACSSSNSAAQGSTAQTAAAAGGGSSSTVASSKVPVDGGYIDTTNNIVVTQPSAGEYKAFTAICTHAGCTVSSVQNNVIQCPCHGSQFSAKDGSVITGPASSPLASKTVTVAGSTITYGA